VADPAPFPSAADLCPLTVDFTKRTIAAVVAYELGRASMAAELQGPFDAHAIDQLADVIGTRVLTLYPTDIVSPTFAAREA